MAFIEEEIINCFQSKAAETWETIKHNFTLKNHKESIEEKNLVDYRDIIDYKLYYEAVEKIFPNYNISKRIGGHIKENRTGDPYFKIRWYEFIVWPRKGPLSQTSCRIQISVLAERTLTSHTNMSIITRAEGELRSLFAGAHPWVCNGGLDYEGRITNAVIDYFYRGSEQAFNMTSSLHRISHAYADLMEEEEQREEYSKFGEETLNPLIDEQHRLFSAEIWQEMRQQFKQKKHRLELAASLFSLRAALKEEEWQAFMHQVQAQLERVKDEFITEKASRKTFGEYASEDVLAIFSEAQALWLHYAGALVNTISSLEKGEDGYVSELEREDEIRNCKIAALNRLYVMHLEKRNNVTAEMKALTAQNNHLLKEVKSFSARLRETEATLAHHQAAFSKEIEHDKQAQIQECEASCASLRTSQQKRIDCLRNSYNELVTLMLTKLELRYQALTFAHEAYVCRSAVYQMAVEEKNKKQASFLSERTLLSSILQQIGLKLLRPQEIPELHSVVSRYDDLDDFGYNITYETAKYTQQLHQLLFGNASVSDEDIRIALKNPLEKNNLDIFEKLKFDLGKVFLFKLFSEEELTYLNCEKRMIALKNDASLSGTERYQRAQQLLNEWADKQQATLTPKELFLSLATKLMTGAYLSKFTRQERLWGGPKLTSPQILPEAVLTLATIPDFEASKAATMEKKRDISTQKKPKHELDSLKRIQEEDMKIAKDGEDRTVLRIYERDAARTIFYFTSSASRENLSKQKDSSSLKKTKELSHSPTRTRPSSVLSSTSDTSATIQHPPTKKIKIGAYSRLQSDWERETINEGGAQDKKLVAMTEQINQLAINPMLDTSPMFAVEGGVGAYIKDVLVFEACIDEPRVDEPRVDEPRVDESRVDEPRVDKSRVDKPRVDELRVDEPWGEDMAALSLLRNSEAFKDEAMVVQLNKLANDQKKEIHDVMLCIAKLFEDGKFQEAFCQYESITEEQLPLEMQYQKAEILMALGEFEKTEEHINKALDDFPDDATLWEYKGLLYLMQDKSKQANETFKQASTFVTNSVRILIYQGYSHLYESSAEEARQCFRAALALGYKDNSLEQVLLMQAKSFLEKKNKELSDEFQRQAFKMASSIPINHQLQFYFLTGLIFEQMKLNSKPTEMELKYELREKSKDIFYLCIHVFANFKPALKKLLKAKWYESLNKFSISPCELKEEEYLGCGSYGEVYRGKWSDQEVAIKKMFLGKISKDAFLQFAQETHVFKKFKHPNIVRYLSVSISQKPYRLIMEYLGKRSLTEYIHNKILQPAISWFAKVQIGEGIVQGLAFLHTNGIAHRDLKPDNILLDQNDCPKLIDFGLSKIKCETESYSSLYPNKAISNQHVGTIPYMAPEVLRAKDEEERKRIAFDKADVFSYGMLMWELAGRKKPWKNIASSEIIKNVGHEKRREVIDNNWPQTYTALMQACWEEDVVKRYAVLEVLTNLKEVQQAIPANALHEGHNGSLVENNDYKLNF